MHQRRRTRFLRSTAVLAASCLAVLLSTPITASAAPPSDTSADGGNALTPPHLPGVGDWPSWQKDLSGSRFNGQERRITPDNVGGLKLKWAFAYPKNGATPHSQPAVVGDTVYF